MVGCVRGVAVFVFGCVFEALWNLDCQRRSFSSLRSRSVLSLLEGKTTMPVCFRKDAESGIAKASARLSWNAWIRFRFGRFALVN